MKKDFHFSNKLFFTAAVISIPFSLIAIRYLTSNVSYTKATDTYTLSLDNRNRITESTEIDVSNELSSQITTENSNKINVNYYQVSKNSNGWQTIAPNGYIYNPVTDEGNNNKLNGITSISFTSDSTQKLSLHYGWSINNTNIIYSTEVELESGQAYEFTDSHPSFFKLINNSTEDIDLDTLTISYSCHEDVYPMNNLNVLMIGNSFADDTVRFASLAAKSYGINLNIYGAYIASCTLDLHYNNWVNNTATYSCRSMNGESWVYEDNKTLPQIVDKMSWDYITFQQASQYVGAKSSYSHLSDLMSLVRARAGEKPIFKWHQTWAYENDYMFNTTAFSQYNNDSDTMFNAIIEAYKSEVAPKTELKGIIPAGTAVQNLRSSYIGETFSRDGLHMSFTHGRYLLALNWLTAFYNIDLDQSPCTYRPTGVNDDFIAPSYEAIRNANKHPLVKTQSVLTTPEMSRYDLTNYTEIDGELWGCSYWNSMDSTNYNKRIANTKDSSNTYVSSKRFTSSTLPVGSIVFVKEGYGFRPDGWKSDTVQSSKPDERHDNVLNITSSFWEGYAYRAFNFFKEGKSDLKGQYDEVFDNVHFFVPTNKLGTNKVKGANTNLEDDRTIFTNKGYNIDKFERLHLDPITGFYKCDSYSDLQNSYVDDTAKKFVCTRPFFSKDNTLPAKTVLIIDSGYQWRSDCWGEYGNTSSRPSTVTTNFTMLDSSFMNNWRVRTFNVNSTNSSVYVGQNGISQLNHLRIYVPMDDDIELNVPPIENVPQDRLTMTALGTVSITGAASTILGSSVPLLITLGGVSTSEVLVQVNGSSIGALGYQYDKETNKITIPTNGEANGYTYGNIMGTVNVSTGTINNISLDGTLKSFVGNNGNITCKEAWGDRCNYSTNEASQAVWQRWYGSTWTANSGSGQWTTSNSTYKLEENYSMGLRIADSSYSRTSFTLKSDLNNGAGITIKGVSIWLYNAGTVTYSGDNFRIFAYTSRSTASGDHVTLSSQYITATSASKAITPGSWIHIQTGVDSRTIYNLRLFFQSKSSSAEFVYVAHVNFY